MRPKIFLLTLCICGGACSSASDLDPSEIAVLDYSLAEVDGEALPGPFSSLPGLLLWEGGDGTMLAVWRGQVVCNADGTAVESFGFRVSTGGSAVWDPIVVELDVTCESAGPERVTFRYPATGEVMNGTLQEPAGGCSALSKGMPSVQSLRSGYRASLSAAELPGGLELGDSMIGEFRQTTCAGP